MRQTNISALHVSNQLNKTSRALDNAFEKLSSGLRINSARDDAAGLSISVRMNTQVQSAQAAQRNANDYISLFQTAEGGLSEIENNLQRMRELAVQSASDSYNHYDRLATQEEIVLLKEQVHNIALNTSFNNIKLLDGTMLQKIAQLGHSSSTQESVSITNSKTTHLGHHTRVDSQVGVFASRIYDFSIQDFGGNAGHQSSVTFVVDQADGSEEAIGVRGTIEQDDLLSSHVFDLDTMDIDLAGTELLRSSSAIAKAKAINASTDLTGVRAIVGTTRTDYDYANVPNIDLAGDSVFIDVGTGDLVLGNTNVIQATTLDTDNVMYINGVGISGFEVKDNDADGMLVDAINAEYDKTGVQATLNANSELVLEAKDGRNIAVQYRHADGTRNLNLMDDIGLLDGADGDFVYGGKISLISAESIEIENFADFNTFITTNDALGVLSDSLDVNGDSIFVTDQVRYMFSTEVVVDDIDVSTVALSERSLLTIDYALNQVSETRSMLGAQMNRFESAMRSLKIEEENLSHATSRIQDTDMALETAHLAQTQIIQQAGTQVLAQANSQNTVLLALL